MLKFPAVISIIILVPSLLFAAAPSPRVWTDKMGQTTRATLVRSSDTEVTLRVGSVIRTFSLADLSPADRNYVLSESLRRWSTRTWRDVSGTYSLSAQLLEVKERKAVFLKPDDNTVEVDMHRLSEADRERIRDNAHFLLTSLLGRPWIDDEGSIYLFEDSKSEWKITRHLCDGTPPQSDFLLKSGARSLSRDVRSGGGRFNVTWNENFNVVFSSLAKPGSFVIIRRMTDAEFAQYEERSRAGGGPLVSDEAVEKARAADLAKWNEKKKKALEEASALLVERHPPIEGVLYQTDVTATHAALVSVILKRFDSNAFTAQEAASEFSRKIPVLKGKRVLWTVPVDRVLAGKIERYVLTLNTRDTGVSIVTYDRLWDGLTFGYEANKRELEPNIDRETAKQLKKGDLIVFTATIADISFTEGIIPLGVMPHISVKLSEFFVISTSIDK